MDTKFDSNTNRLSTVNCGPLTKMYQVRSMDSNRDSTTNRLSTVDRWQNCTKYQVRSMDSKPIHTTPQLSTVDRGPLTKMYQVRSMDSKPDSTTNRLSTVDRWQKFSQQLTVDRQQSIVFSKRKPYWNLNSKLDSNYATAVDSQLWTVDKIGQSTKYGF